MPRGRITQKATLLVKTIPQDTDLMQHSSPLPHVGSPS